MTTQTQFDIERQQQKIDELLNELEAEVACYTYNRWYRRREPTEIRVDIKREIATLVGLEKLGN